MKTENRLLSTKEVSERLGVCTLTVRRWTKKGTLTAVRVGPRLLRYRLADIKKIEEGQ
jgi:excisionase family DNA binding protein